MSLEATIREIRETVQSAEYASWSEQAISQGVVLRLLGNLDWPIFDTQLVVPEYKVAGQRVDFALCIAKDKPRVFIEVKIPGKIQGADEQVFQYAFHEGIPFVIVTDGRTWHFYLTMVEGKYEDRRVYTLDLVERDADESVKRLKRYLLFDAVKDKDRTALKNAQHDYEDVHKEKQAKEHVPLAWAKLLEEKDETLIGLISEKTENLCGFEPTDTQVITHLRSLKPEAQRYPYSPPVQKEHPRHPQREVGIAEKRRTSDRVKLKVTFPDGTVIYNNKVAKTMIEVIRKIGFGKVESLDIRQRGFSIVSRLKHGKEWTDAGSGFFVSTYSSTARKLRQLNEINDRLQLGLKVEEI